VKKYTFLVIVIVAGIGMMAAVFGSDFVKMSVPTQEYEVFVDPIICTYLNIFHRVFRGWRK